MSTAGSDLFLLRLSSEGEFLWFDHYTGIGDSYVNDLIIDKDDNVLLTGVFTNEIYFESDTPLPGSGNHDIFLAKLASRYKEPAPGVVLKGYNVDWSKRAGGSRDDEGYAVAMNASGDVAFAGYSLDHVNLGGGLLPFHGGSEIFVGVYNVAGIHRWSRSFGAQFWDKAYAVAIDSSGNVAIAGTFKGSVKFDDITLESTNHDNFVAKLNSDGKVIWAKSFGGSGDEAAWAVELDDDGNLYLSGVFVDSIQLNDNDNDEAVGGRGAYIAKFGQYGSHLWSNIITSSNSIAIKSISLRGNGSLVVCSYFKGDLIFLESGDTPVSYTSDTNVSSFVAKYKTTNGELLWSDVIKGSKDVYAISASINDSEEIAVTGYATGNFQFEGDLVLKRIDDIFLLKYKVNDSNNEVIREWGKMLGGNGTDYGRAVDINNLGNIVVSGHFSGNVDFGGERLTSNGRSDIFVALYDKTGAHLWSNSYGNGSDQICRGIAMDEEGNLALTGFYEGNISFDRVCRIQ